MRTDYEYIVLGCRGIGSATAYWLSRRKSKDVLGIEQFEHGHHGSYRLAIDGRIDYPIEPFALQRYAITDPNFKPVFRM